MTIDSVIFDWAGTLSVFGIAIDQHSFTLAWLLAQASEAVGVGVAAAVLEEASTGHLDA